MTTWKTGGRRAALAALLLASAVAWAGPRMTEGDAGCACASQDMPGKHGAACMAGTPGSKASPGMHGSMGMQGGMHANAQGMGGEPGAGIHGKGGHHGAGMQGGGMHGGGMHGKGGMGAGGHAGGHGAAPDADHGRGHGGCGAV